jgi:hypothetical protein
MIAHQFNQQFDELLSTITAMVIQSYQTKMNGALKILAILTLKKLSS